MGRAELVGGNRLSSWGELETPLSKRLKTAAVIKAALAPISTKLTFPDRMGRLRSRGGPRALAQFGSGFRTS